MSDVVAFLNACVDADREWADGVLADPSASNDHGIARRMLREVEAKRRIVNSFQTAATADRYGEPNEFMDGYTTSLDIAVRALVAVWSDHPDYDPAWGQP